ncbi:MAG: hypothetical protein JNM74_02985 [Myxococcales bacterium]|nr:hypothetical protein [Myxococcales bacterium]
MAAKRTTKKPAVRPSALDPASDPKALAKHVADGYFRFDAATTPALEGLAALPVRGVVLGKKVKEAPGLVTLLETSRTIVDVVLYTAGLLERAPRSTAVTSLTIEGATTKDLDFLRGFGELRELSIGSRQTSLASFEGIALCPKLTRLRAKQHLARTLAPLAALEHLEQLVAPMAKNLGALDGLVPSSLVHVDVNLSPIRDLAPLAGAAGLLALKMRGSKVSSITPLLGCSRLQTLYAERTALTSIDGIGERLRDLRLLWIGDTKVTDLAPLAGLDSLLDLDLTGLGRVTDFSVVARLPGLRYLNLFDTAFADVGVLEVLPELRRVHLGRTKVSPKDPRVKKLDAALRKRDRHGGVIFEADAAMTPLSNSEAAFASIAYDPGSTHNPF